MGFSGIIFSGIKLGVLFRSAEESGDDSTEPSTVIQGRLVRINDPSDFYLQRPVALDITVKKSG